MPNQALKNYEMYRAHSFRMIHDAMRKVINHNNAQADKLKLYKGGLANDNIIIMIKMDDDKAA